MSTDSVHVADDPNNRTVPVSLLRKLDGGDPLVVCRAIFRGGGGREWHILECQEDLVHLMERYPRDRFEVYEVGAEICCMTMKGGSY